ncbi:hypothetical protein BUALT_Bualt19G0099300 [Buddleja alternifolia]|uniref:squalene monooxygenase n=1 Tax=Buddleja alternifolia TaxID=168488 RepID=A0AAV6W8I2_9LAMI|nr:hypothetical protein BUALT_Bualt19G0099300 [Buddleja alternifolia]
MVMIDRYILGSFIASLFGFVLLYNLRKKISRKTKASKVVRRDECITSAAATGRQDSGGDADIIIVGAGVAGAALAYTLGKEGRRVHVIERDLTEPDRIVGELLQPGGYLKLIELGLEDCVGDIDAQRVFGYALYKDGKDTKLSYPLEKFDSDVSGRSFHNGRFIQRMREKAETLSNVRLEQGTVTSLLEEKGTIKGVQYKTKNGDEITAYAPLTIVCDGCFSNLRRSLCTPKVEQPSCFVGIILENCELPYANHGHVVLGDPSPILFYPISSTEIRCLVDVPGQKVPSISNGEMAKYLKTVVAPQIPPQLYDSFIGAIEKGNIRTMPNRSMPAIPQPTPGAILMGDAFNMRHPLTGGGMTVALSDIVLLRDLLRPIHDLNDASTLCQYLESFYTLRKPVSSTINTLAGALYKVFCASPDDARREMRDACFDYLSLGGICSEGPVALLSGLNPRPLSLFLHFFGVAVYGVGRLLLPFPSPQRVWLGARLLSAASGIIFPIIKAEGVRQMFFPATVPAMVETLNEPKTILGELLQPAGYLKLLELGLDDCVKEIDAQQVLEYVLYKDRKSIRLPYPLKKYESNVSGRSFYHGRFVQRMREKAASLPNVKLVQGTATSLIDEKGTIKGVKYKTRAGEESKLYAPLTVVCDGCFSNFRKFLEASLKSVSLIDFSATKLHSVSNGQMAHFLKNIFAPQVPIEVYSAFMASVDKAQIKVMPTNCIPASPRIPGALLLGDALNMRHAITGGGMTVAINDVATLSNLLRHLNLNDVEMPMAFTINVIADSLCKAILLSSGESSDEIQEACFNYMSLGHNFSRGLLGLVSGLDWSSISFP